MEILGGKGCRGPHGFWYFVLRRGGRDGGWGAVVWPEATGGHATTVLSRWWAEVVLATRGVNISVF